MLRSNLLPHFLSLSRFNVLNGVHMLDISSTPVLFVLSWNMVLLWRFPLNRKSFSNLFKRFRIRWLLGYSIRISTKSKFFMEFWVLYLLRTGSLTYDAAFSFILSILLFLILFGVFRYSKLMFYIEILLWRSRASFHTLSSSWLWRNSYFPDGRESLIDPRVFWLSILLPIVEPNGLLIESYYRLFSTNGLCFHGVVAHFFWIRSVYAKNDGIVDIFLVFPRELWVLNFKKTLYGARKNNRRTFVKWISYWMFKNGVWPLNGFNYGRGLWILQRKKRIDACSFPDGRELQFILSYLVWL